MNKDKLWKDRARAAFEKYLEDLETDLSPQSNLAEIEQAMLKHYRRMMSETMQSLVEHQDFPPSKRS